MIEDRPQIKFLTSILIKWIDIVMHSRENIVSTLSENQAEFKKYGIERIGLFGSFSKDNATETSDIDILIKLSPGSLSFHNYMEIKLYLESIFSRKVDLVIEDDLRSEIKNDILNSVIYAA